MVLRLEHRRGAFAITRQKRRAPKRAEQRRRWIVGSSVGIRRQGNGAGRVVCIDGSANRVDARNRIAGRHGERGREFGACRVVLAIVAQGNAEEMMRRRKPGLQVEDLSISRARVAAIALAMRDHRTFPERMHAGRIGHRRARLRDRQLHRLELCDKRRFVRHGLVDQRRSVRGGQCRDRHAHPCRSLRQQHSGRRRQPCQVHDHVGVQRRNASRIGGGRRQRQCETRCRAGGTRHFAADFRGHDDKARGWELSQRRLHPLRQRRAAANEHDNP